MGEDEGVDIEEDYGPGLNGPSKVRLGAFKGLSVEYENPVQTDYRENGWPSSKSKRNYASM